MFSIRSRMAPRSTRYRDFDAAYPVRIRLVQPDRGWGQALDHHASWARAQLGPGAMATGASTISGGRDVTTLYFRLPEDAWAFLAAFPDVRLADDVDRLGIRFDAPPGRPL